MAAAASTAAAKAAAAAIRGTLGGWTPAAGALPVGTWAEITRAFTLEDTAAFARLAGDHNPVHLDPAFAATTRFGRPIVHGMLYGSLFGTMFGATVAGSIYVSQTFKFRAPVYVGERFTARMTVASVKTAPHHMATCDTVIVKEDGSTACTGQAVVMLPPPLA